MNTKSSSGVVSIASKSRLNIVTLIFLTLSHRTSITNVDAPSTFFGGASKCSGTLIRSPSTQLENNALSCWHSLLPAPLGDARAQSKYKFLTRPSEELL